jgi:AcrR family transcriptional regulator
MDRETKQTKAEAKRAYLIEQAARCLAEKGYAHVSLRDIARESGVSLGILHYYFASKEELLLAVIQSYKDRFIVELEQALLKQPIFGWMDRFIAVLRDALIRDRDTHRLWYDFQVQAMYLPPFRAEVTKIRSRMLELIDRVILRLQAEEKIAEVPYHRDLLVSVLYSLIDGLFFQALLSENDQTEEAIARLEQGLPAVLAPFLKL